MSSLAVEGVVVRAARPSDLEAVLALARRAALLEPGIVEAFGAFVVATHDDGIVGAAGLERYSPYGLVRTVVVAPELRQRAVGRLLVRATLERARAHELTSVYLLTTTAREFFAKLGFEVVGRDSAPAPIRDSWEFKTGCPATAVLMARAISD